jgi:hypothetical protein
MVRLCVIHLEKSRSAHPYECRKHGKAVVVCAIKRLVPPIFKLKLIAASNVCTGLTSTLDPDCEINSERRPMVSFESFFVIHTFIILVHISRKTS